MLTLGEDVEAHALAQRGWSISSIARHLGRDRKTVRAYVTAQRSPGVRRRPAPDPLEPRGWIATKKLLIERQWRLARARGGVPLSTGALEGKIGEWLAPLARRAGRWQNRRRLNLVLGLITLRGPRRGAPGPLREARAGPLRGPREPLAPTSR